ncbi:efflux RND transporter permease subunit [Myxococcota bacterium]|nr:efflux RND transporter permease subunit [Myxococcota bacterium]
MKLADVSIRRPVLATVMISLLLVFGIVAYPRLGVDLMPNVEFPFVTVTVVYPGADPETIEDKVVDKLEEAVNTINGIRELRSTSLENVGFLLIQFELERSADQAVQDVRDKVSAVLRDLPQDLDPPLVQRLDINAMPILTAAVFGDLPVQELTRIADEQVKQRLQVVPGVGSVDLIGAQQREVQVLIDPARMQSHHLAPGDLAQALAYQNLEVPGGNLDEGSTERAVKTRGEVHSAEELAAVVVGSVQGTPIRVGDVARVEDAAAERRSHSSVNGRSAVVLSIRKQSGANTVETAHRVKEELERLKARLPAGVSLSIPRDDSVFIEHAIGDVRFDLAFGALLAILIVWVFLRDWRATFISALALPTSVVATFGFMQAMGFTMNQMTMLALSLSIGILIDDAIVVIEAIHRHLQMGKGAMQAAREATAEIGLAVMATTAAILAVFVPVATMKGMIGRFFFQFGLTVAFAVAVSLFVAFTLTPMLSARMLRREEGHGAISRFLGGLLDRIDSLYRGTLKWALGHRGLVLGIALLFLLGTLALVPTLRTEFMPQSDRSQALVHVEFPEGTHLRVTTEMMEAIAARVREVPGVTQTMVTIGGGSLGEVNKGDLQVDLVPKGRRTYSQEEAIVFLRRLVQQMVPDARVAVEPNEQRLVSGTRNAPIQYVIRGRDLGQVQQAADSLADRLARMPGFAGVDTTHRGGRPEVALLVDRQRAADLGVMVGQVAGTVRTFFAGDKATEVTMDGDRVDVRLRLDDAWRRGPSDIPGLAVRSTTGNLVPLAQLVRLEEGTGPSRIERLQRERQVTVMADLEGIAQGNAMKQVEAVAREVLPEGVTGEWAGMNKVMEESFGYLITALMLAVVMVYLILAAQFESFLHPFTIMMSLPFSLVGAFLGLLITGKTLNIATFIGLILLMGLVVKNAILLVDYANQRKEAGDSTREALLKAGPIRLRPILMTTAAMIFGMLPVAAGLSEGSEIRSPMAVAVIGGLITSTLLTLVVVPVVYSLLEGIRESRRSPA